MILFTDWFAFLSGVVTLLGMAFVVVYAASFLFPQTQLATYLRGKVRQHHLLFGFCLSVAATVATLVYSEIIAYEPCEFCWLQRIALYPQVVIFGVALFRKEVSEYLVPLILSLSGMVLAAIHIGIQVTEDSIFCLPGEVTCSTIYITEFGFITMPVMSLVMFSMLVIFALNGRASR